MSPSPRRPSGFTLVEACTVLAVLAVLAGAVLPDFHNARLRRQLEGAAAQLETDLQLGRAEAVARNESLRMAFTRDASGSCYVVHSGPAGGCRCDGGGAVVCVAGAEALRSVSLDSASALQLQSNSAALLFDAVKGTVTPTATVKLQSPVAQLHQVVNIMGRVRSCSPDARMAAYKRC